ncbi:hypothetical protein P389DRAFT_44982 [Cystobasidium minutum MCA 4210]|uniref:uncharacterized protein n=1 Tax=Cystobasidium minutum MCA 4210 TaxID=1397322 RepID=UPI0034CF6A5F|eukprot:jgi/Rhomi1/44982/CE44981_587
MQVSPDLPWGGTTDVAGQDCKIGWALDTTGLWKNMSIELMTGDNQHFVHLSWVAHGLDGTTGDGSYTWTCPVVDPPAPIYFYQFTNPGQPATYTTRFTLAAADGTTVAAPEQTQPTGENIPWGTGRLVSGGDGTADSGSGSSSGGSSSGSSNSTTSGSSSSSSSSSSPSSSSSRPSSSTSDDNSSSSTDDAETTVITVQPTDSSTTALSSARGASSSLGVSSAIGGNANGNNNSTGAATTSQISGNMMKGLGLILAVSAGWIMA